MTADNKLRQWSIRLGVRTEEESAMEGLSQVVLEWVDTYRRQIELFAKAQKPLSTLEISVHSDRDPTQPHEMWRQIDHSSTTFSTASR
jgi:phage FluMu protein gp41